MKAKFSHVMNDDITGVTFIYFDSGYVQDIEHDADVEFSGQFCIHMQESDTKKLILALQNEPIEHLTVFNKQEMKLLRELPKGDFVLPMQNWTKPPSLTDREWKEFLAKLS